MADILLPPWLNIARARFRYIDSTGASRNPYTGNLRTASLGGDRIGASVEMTPTGGASNAMERAALMAFTMQARKSNRVWLMDPSYRPRGSFPAGELLTNNTFENGTTGWAAYNSSSNLTVADRRLRATYNNASLGCAFRNSSALTSLSQYQPYVLRAMLSSGRGDSSSAFLRIGTTVGGTEVAASTFSSFGLLSAAGVSSAVASIYTTIGGGSDAGRLAGDYFECPYVSLSRCALVDNGGNSLLFSDQLDNAAWQKVGSTVTANAGSAPDGTATADDIIEDTSTGEHLITQNVTRVSVAQDLCVYGLFSNPSGTRGVRLLVDGADGSGAVCTFDLQAGTAGTPSTTGSGSNARAFIASAGNGSYFCCLIARCLATTSIRGRANIVNAGSVSYTGNGTANIRAWRFGAAPSSVPTRGAQTTTTASTGTSQTGSALHIKGLPASTNGLLLYGDWVQIGNQINMVTASLDSDAAGLGYLQCAVPWRTAPSDNDPVIITNPMGRFVYAGEQPEYMTEPGLFTSASYEFEEAA